MTHKRTLVAALIAIAACGLSFAAPVQAGTCQSVRAKGVGKNLATATKYAQADLKQTAKSMKGKVTAATTNCEKVFGDFHCHIDATVCPK
jgi:hypothetical protein